MVYRLVGTRWFFLAFGLCLFVLGLFGGCAPSPRADHGDADTVAAKSAEHVKGHRADDVEKKKRQAKKRPVSQTDGQKTSPSEAAQNTPPIKTSKQWRPPRYVEIDAKVLNRAGIRRLDGKHLALYTDLPSSRAVDELPAVFDKAFPGWCEYFGLDAAKHEDWRVTCFLMKEKGPFERLDLMPIGVPLFRHGYSQGDRLWLYEQPSDYYRRHLLLHEGTHVFMNMLLGGCGPPWYMEGTAELLATHRYEDGRLELGFFPSARGQVPMWGRTKIVADAIAAGRGKSFDDVLGYGTTAHLDQEPYGWCWATAVLLDRHPRYQKRFRRLHENVLDSDFNESFRQLIGDDWPDLAAEWQAFVAELDFGHDFDRETIRLKPAEPLPPGGKTVWVEAGLGWQNSGVLLRGGRKYRLTATGRYQVADKLVEARIDSQRRATNGSPASRQNDSETPINYARNKKIWWCEPGGITIRYYRGRPLGMLLGVVYPRKNPGAAGNAAQIDGNGDAGTRNPFLKPTAIGLGATLSPREDGVLLLKINDPPAELHDNAGRLQVRIKATGLTD